MKEVYKMGERYQIHVFVEKYDKYNDEKENIAISIHAQWMWGVHIIRNMNRLLTTLDNSSNMEYVGKEELIKYIDSILYVNKSLNGKHYIYPIHTEEPYFPEQGDSNHGWCIVKLVIDKKGNTKVFSRFYDTSGNPVYNDKLWDDCVSDFKYYKWTEKDKKTLKKLLDSKLFNNTKKDLQSEFKGLVKNWEKEVIRNQRKVIEND